MSFHYGFGNSPFFNPADYDALKHIEEITRQYGGEPPRSTEPPVANRSKQDPSQREETELKTMKNFSNFQNK